MPKPKEKIEEPNELPLPIGASPKDVFVAKPKIVEQPNQCLQIQCGTIVSVLALSINMKALLINTSSRMLKIGLPCPTHEASQLQRETSGMWISMDKVVAL